MYDDEIRARLERELDLFKAHVEKFREERDLHTHWPMLDAIAETSQEEIAQKAMEGVMSGNPPDPALLMGLYTQVIEQVFWWGYKFAKGGEALTECPEPHRNPYEDPHGPTRPVDPRWN
jgi:hypothetical protein